MHNSRLQTFLSTNIRGDVLEVECGNGWGTSNYINENKQIKSLTLTDDNIGNIKYAKSQLENRIKTLSFKLSEERNFPFDDESFDTVVCIDGLSYVTDPVTTLREMQRVCKKKWENSYYNSRKK